MHRLRVPTGFLAASLVVGLPILAADVASTGLPALSPAPGPRDFGRVQPRTRLTHTLAFTNVGSAPLEIRDLQASCSCVQPAARTLTIPAGSQATLDVGLLAPDLSGPFRETLTYTSNDPLHTSGSVAFLGSVFRMVEAIPDFAVLAVTPDSGTNESVRVRIVNHGADLVDIGEPRGTNPAFDARLITRVPGREYELVLRTTRPLSNANHFGPFKLRTSSPEVPELTVTAFVPGLAAVVATPREIRLPPGPLTRPDDLVRSIFVRCTTDHVLAVSNAAVNLTGVRVSLETREPGQRIVARVEFPPGWEPSPGPPPELKLHTNHPRFPVLRIPIIRQANPVELP